MRDAGVDRGALWGGDGKEVNTSYVYLKADVDGICEGIEYACVKDRKSLERTGIFSLLFNVTSQSPR